MGESFMRNGRWMTLEQARQYQKNTTTQNTDSDTSIESIKSELDKLGIKYHWNAGEDKLRNLLQNSKKEYNTNN